MLIIYIWVNIRTSGGILLILFIYMFLYQTYGGLDIHIGATPILKVAPGILRGIADVGLGIWGYIISKNKNITHKKIIKIGLRISLIIIIFFSHIQS